jgi:ribose 5-phosphate isomerase B
MTTPTTVAIASDHAGFDLKSILAETLRNRGLTVLDLGAGNATDSVDYPDFGRAAAEVVAGGKADLGVIVCGSGIGISIAANRVPGCRAALCHDVTTARLSRQHNDANVLALGARITGPGVAQDCLEAFLETPFEGGRHQRRIEKL